MNKNQQKYTAFMESVCKQFDHPEMLPALKEGFKAFCEAVSLTEGTGLGISYEDEKKSFIDPLYKHVKEMPDSPAKGKAYRYITSKWDKLDQHFPEDKLPNHSEACSVIAGKILNLLQESGDISMKNAQVRKSDKYKSSGSATIVWDEPPKPEDGPDAYDPFTFRYTVRIGFHEAPSFRVGSIDDPSASEFYITKPTFRSKYNYERDEIIHSGDEEIIYEGSNIRDAAECIRNDVEGTHSSPWGNTHRAFTHYPEEYLQQLKVDAGFGKDFQELD